MTTLRIVGDNQDTKVSVSDGPEVRPVPSVRRRRRPGGRLIKGQKFTPTCTSIQRTLSNIRGFENKYDFTTDELLKQERNGTLNDDSLEFIEWIGETKMLKWLEEELELLEQINIRC